MSRWPWSGFRGCRSVRSQLGLFVGGDLESRAAGRVRDHLRHCVACRNEAGTLLRTVRRLGSLRGVVPPGVDEAWFAALHGDVMEHVAGQRRPVPSAMRRTLVRAGAAAAMVLFGLGLWIEQPVGGLMSRTPIRAGGQDFGGSGELRDPVLQPLADDVTFEWPIDAARWAAPGLSGRPSLRTLDQRGVLWLVRGDAKGGAADRLPRDLCLPCSGR